MPLVRDQEKDNGVPHVWYIQSEEGGKREGCRHLAMSEEGAVQAFLIHHGMMGYSGKLEITNEGPITAETDRESICLDPHCVLYGLSFPKKGGDNASSQEGT